MGCRHVKEDWCNASGLDARVQYAKFRDALARTGRPIVFSICEWGSNQPWDWAPKVGNLWRTTDDIEDKWMSMLANLDQSGQHATVARPGAWKDPDMLEVGNGGMTDDEYRAHLSLWAIMAAPLIAVDQDSLGAQGILVWEPQPELQVWAKSLRDGSHAVALLNRSSNADTITAYFSRVGLHNDSARVRDLWSHSEVGRFKGKYSTVVKPHGVVMVRMTALR